MEPSPELVCDIHFLVERSSGTEEHRVRIGTPAAVRTHWECTVEMTEYGSTKVIRGVDPEQAIEGAQYLVEGAYSFLVKRTSTGATFEWPWNHS